MIAWEKVTKEETVLINKIVKRACKSFPKNIKDGMSLDMDISATHISCPLRLTDLLAADKFNFAHDVFGIMSHINRETGNLEHCFVPRFAK